MYICGEFSRSLYHLSMIVWHVLRIKKKSFSKHSTVRSYAHRCDRTIQFRSPIIFNVAFVCHKTVALVFHLIERAEIKAFMSSPEYLEFAQHQLNTSTNEWYESAQLNCQLTINWLYYSHRVERWDSGHRINCTHTWPHDHLTAETNVKYNRYIDFRDRNHKCCAAVTDR